MGCNKPARLGGKETGEGLRKATVGTSLVHGCGSANRMVTSEGVGPLSEDGRRAVMVVSKRTRRVDVL